MHILDDERPTEFFYMNYLEKVNRIEAAPSKV